MGNLKVALFLAWKSIVKGNRWALIFIILVMSLSFVNLTFTSSILSGVTDTLDEQMVNNLLANVVIDPPEDEYYIDRAHQSEEKLKQVPGVTGVATHLNSSAFIEYQWREKESPSDKGKSGTWNVIGIDPQQEMNVTTIHEHIIEGSYLAEGDRDEIVLGIDIAGGEGAQVSSHLTLGGVKVGDKVRLTYPNGAQREYRVKGIFQAKEIMVTDHLAFVTRKEMVSVMGRQVFSDRASQILVRTEEMGGEGWFIEEFEALGINGVIRSWREYGGSVRGIVSSFDVVTSLISGIGLVVAAIVMFIVIYIGVINKKRQIGILRAIGIRGKIIIHSYLVQALFYAVSGIITGWLLVHFMVEPYFALHPLDLSLGQVSLSIQASAIQNSVLGLILASILAGYLPVLGITRQSIIKAIWGA